MTSLPSCSPFLSPSDTLRSAKVAVAEKAPGHAKIQSLENLRGFAAVYVFLCHRLSTGHPHLGPFAFGKEAVFLFFFLSGFVIYTSFQTHPHQSFKDYFRRRFLRIFPLYLLCLFLSWLTLSHLQPPPESRSWASFFGNVFMLQDDSGSKPGVWFGPFCGNSPLWSLSYEWWFYMMFFPLITLLSVWRQRLAVGGMAVLAFLIFALHPNQVSLFLMYFPVWWVGLELARVRRASHSEQRRTYLYFLAIFGVMAVISALRIVRAHLHHVPLGFGTDPVLELRNFVFCGMCLAFVALTPLGVIKKMLAALFPFGWIAPISYAVYILHMPLAVKGRYLGFLGHPWLETIGYVVVLVAVATWGETIYQRGAQNLYRTISTLWAGRPRPVGIDSAQLANTTLN